MSDLKPCPFCGGNAQLTTWTPTAASISCIMCGAHFNTYTEAEAIAAWNSRVGRTCEMETDHDELEVIAYSHEDTWAYKCGVCDWSFRYDRGIKPNYCPSCGCKVVSE